MTTKLLYFLLLNSFLTLGQRPIVEITGRVTDSDDPNLRIYGLFVKLVISDTVSFETKCDSLGNYKFEILSTLVKNSTGKISPRQDNKTMRSDFRYDQKCPFHSYPNEYRTRDYSVIEFGESDKNFIANFSIRKLIFDFRLPCLSFQKNRTTPEKCGDDEPEIAINFLECLLTHHPKAVIEIQGRAWNERASHKLSLRRSRLIKKKLVESGIDELRIKTSGVGNKSPIFSTQAIFTEADAKKRIEMERTNRSIYFKIVSFDYDPTTKRLVPTKTETSNEIDD